MRPLILCVGGEDHDLRIPFLHALGELGFRVAAAGSGEPARFAQSGIEYHKFQLQRFVNPLADWRAIRGLSAILTTLRPDLVQTFDTKPNLLLPLAARGVPDMRIVRTINGMGWLYSSDSLKARALRPAYLLLQRLAAGATAATVFQNAADQAFFERGGIIGRQQGHLIAGSGIDIEQFQRAQAAGPSPARLREVLGLGESEIVITVTRLTRVKGVATLLRAAELVHQRRSSVRFLLVGPRQSEGPLAISQAEIDRHRPYVIALGQRSDIPSLLGAADVFAFPTEYREGVPRVLLEAALAGLPIVATDMPGCTDIVRDGWSGLLVPPRAPDLLAARIIDLLGDRAAGRAMSERAATLVREQFGLGLTAARYASLYEQLLRGGRPPVRLGALAGATPVTLGRSDHAAAIAGSEPI